MNECSIEIKTKKNYIFFYIEKKITRRKKSIYNRLQNIKEFRFFVEKKVSWKRIQQIVNKNFVETKLVFYINKLKSNR